MGAPGTARVIAAMAVAVVAVSFSSIFATELDRRGVGPLAISFYRMAMTTLLLLPPTLALRRRELAAQTGRGWGLLLLGGFFLAIHFGAWYASLIYLPISTAVVLVNSHPLFVVAAAYLLLGERPSRRGLFGTVVGLLGMAIIGRDGFRGFDAALLGQTLAVTGALAFVGYLIVGRVARARVSLLGYVTPLYAACAVILLLWCAAAGTKLGPFPAAVWGYFIALAVVPTILGHTVFNWAIRHVGPSAVSLAFLGEPIVASALAYLFFGQTPPMATFVGGPFVLAGIYLTTAAGRPARAAALGEAQ